MNKKNLLLIRPDHIGDYIFFRNIIQSIKNAEKFQDYNIYLLLNERIKELVEFLDSDVACKIFFIDLREFIQQKWYFQRKLQEIGQFHYETVINTMFARYDAIEELIGSLKTDEKILIKDKVHQNMKFQDEHFDQAYTSVYDTTNDKLFEFDKLKSVFEIILEKKILERKPTIHLPNDRWQNSLKFQNEYVVIFIGSDALFRKWNVYNYIEVIKYILDCTNLCVVLCGGKEELEEAILIEEAINSTKFYNTVAQTSLVDILYIIAHSRVVISNETGSAHITVALDKPILVISNGNHFGKFTPYPSSYTNKYFALYPFVYDDKSFDYFRQLYSSGSDLDINLITVERVIVYLQQLLEQQSIQFKLKKRVVIEQKPLFYMPAQIKRNYEFAIEYSHFFSQVVEIKTYARKVVIYGNGSMGKTIDAILGDHVLCIVDVSSTNLSKKIEKNQIYSPKSLSHLIFDKIIISLLGRENDVEKFLIEECNVKEDKIIKFKINQKDRYQTC